MNRSLLKIIATACIFVPTTQLFASPSPTLDGEIPIVLICNTANVAGNSDVSFTVRMNQPCTTDQWVSIGVSKTGEFSEIPTEVFVPAGSDRATFYAHTASTYDAAFAVSATSNGRSALWFAPATGIVGFAR